MPLSATILGTENAVGFFRIGCSPHGEASTKPHTGWRLPGRSNLCPNLIPEVGDEHGIGASDGKKRGDPASANMPLPR